MSETNFDKEFPQHENLATKIFSDLCCSNCQCQYESKPITPTDAMGREVFWEDLGRPQD